MVPKVLDIRSKKTSEDVKAELESMLHVPNNCVPVLPFQLLYDEAGLRHFEEITKLQEYYPSKTERRLLDDFAGEIVRGFTDDTVLIELGSGNLSKTAKILEAFSKSGKRRLRYFALDLDYAELDRTIASLPQYSNVSCQGLWGTFEDGFEWMKKLRGSRSSLQLLFLGSSIGNFDVGEAKAFIQSAVAALRPGHQESFYIAFDHCQDREKIWNAYHDPKGTNAKFIMNALKHANRIYGADLFDLNAWAADGAIEAAEMRHELFYRALHDTNVGKRRFRKDQRIDIGHSIKYSLGETQRLFRRAKAYQADRWLNSTGDYGLYKLEPYCATHNEKSGMVETIIRVDG